MLCKSKTIVARQEPSDLDIVKIRGSPAKNALGISSKEQVLFKFEGSETKRGRKGLATTKQQSYIQIRVDGERMVNFLFPGHV